MANKKENIKEVKILFKELYHCMRVISENEEPTNQRFFADEQQMTSFYELMAQCLNTIAVNKEHQLATIEEKSKSGQIDEEDEAQIKEELYKITAAATYINEAACVIFNVYGQSVENLTRANLVPYFSKII